MPTTRRPQWRIALLRNHGGDAAGNAALVGDAFADLGAEAVHLDIDSIRADPDGVLACDDRGGSHALNGATATWLFGFGNQTSTLDRFELLETHLPDMRWVSRPPAIITWHGKQALISVPAPLQLPESWVSSDAEWLFEAARGRHFVLKPTAGSFGRGVERLAGDARTALAQLRAATRGGRYVLLQQRVLGKLPEHRVLVAGGQVIGCYARRPADRQFAANLANSATALPGQLEQHQLDACARLGEQLAARGIGYAGIDLLWPWVLEVNVVNPGGLATLVELGDRRAPRRLAVAVLDNLSRDVARRA